ncbi:hypothetical protein F751_6336 [Auxenochlorella protothecoides]|uniref:Uncharacterized protein n=1 Tax=Auxenochlorella protothecoides TaxID=3075 RepID=A0A087SSW1_AUXPR|nr:hypothetical protein F751_6336 [Auxenochlorella protothecoides]KFM28815.1 hypothetical protein F751_6336 [Auxenochlorella protothecoides]
MALGTPGLCIHCKVPRTSAMHVPPRPQVSLGMHGRRPAADRPHSETQGGADSRSSVPDPDRKSRCTPL